MILDQAARQSQVTYTPCGPETDRSSWNPWLVQFFDYWLSIRPRNRLPGRQHFDPLDIPLIMPRVWILDVLRAPLRYRYRLAGTKEVETLQREVTGKMFDEVHPHLRGQGEAFGRLDEMAQTGIATYRRGPVVAVDHKKHLTLANNMGAFGRDGKTSDMMTASSGPYFLLAPDAN